MKQGIHPEYMVTSVVCACGNRFETMSTQEELHVEICSVCHPFYTGKQRLVDTAGRVDRFKKKYEKASRAEKTDESEDAAPEGAARQEEAPQEEAPEGEAAEDEAPEPEKAAQK